jgi:hypothetical protein
MLPDPVAVPRVVQPVPVIVVEGVDGAVVVGEKVEIVGVVVPSVPSDTLGIGTAANPQIGDLRRTKRNPRSRIAAGRRRSR